jgi:hypothetical protein
LAVELHDVTTLHFGTDLEDSLRKVGMSKERRVDAQVTVGLFTTKHRVPVASTPVQGNKAETTTLTPVLPASGIVTAPAESR